MIIRANIRSRFSYIRKIVNLRGLFTRKKSQSNKVEKENYIRYE